MAQQQFDPDKFIGREYEQNTFRELLAFSGDERLLLIQDTGGMGKSLLLQQFRHLCQIATPPIPATLIPLDQLSDQHPYALMAAIARDLGEHGVQFTRFNQAERVRTRDDLTAVSPSSSFHSSEGQSTANRGDDIRDTGETSLVEAGDSQPIRTPQQAFFDDLRRLEQPVVLLLDAFERASVTLAQWIADSLPEAVNIQQQTAIVIAGRQVPAITGPAQRIDELTRWERTHVIQFLDRNGYDYTARHLEIFGQMADRGMPPSLIIQGVNAVLRRPNR